MNKFDASNINAFKSDSNYLTFQSWDKRSKLVFVSPPEIINACFLSPSDSILDLITYPGSFFSYTFWLTTSAASTAFCGLRGRKSSFDIPAEDIVRTGIELL